MLTQVMLASERAVSRKFSRTYYWSPALSQTVNALHYWKLILKKAKGGLVSEKKLDSLKKPADMVVISHHLKEAHANLKLHQEHHSQLREEHLQVLAEAKCWIGPPTS